MSTAEFGRGLPDIAFKQADITITLLDIRFRSITGVAYLIPACSFGHMVVRCTKRADYRVFRRLGQF